MENRVRLQIHRMVRSVKCHNAMTSHHTWALSSLIWVMSDKLGVARILISFNMYWTLRRSLLTTGRRCHFLCNIRGAPVNAQRIRHPRRHSLTVV